MSEPSESAVQYAAELFKRARADNVAYPIGLIEHQRRLVALLFDEVVALREVAEKAESLLNVYDVTHLLRCELNDSTVKTAETRICTCGARDAVAEFDVSLAKAKRRIETTDES